MRMGENRSQFQNHSLGFGLYKDFTKRWYWNADLKLNSIHYYNNNYNYFSSDSLNLVNTFKYNGLGMSMNYRIGYKFIDREKFNASFFLGINASTIIYAQMESISNNSSYSNSISYNLSRPNISFLGGIQAEYMLNDRNSIFMNYEFSNAYRFNSISNNLGNLQIGFRRSFIK